MPHAWMMLRRDGGLEEVKLKTLYFLNLKTLPGLVWMEGRERAFPIP